MLQRLYVHNFRCLENFELNVKEMPSILLIGKNGVGKTTVSFALEILRDIGRAKTESVIWLRRMIFLGVELMSRCGLKLK